MLRFLAPAAALALVATPAFAATPAKAPGASAHGRTVAAKTVRTTKVTKKHS